MPAESGTASQRRRSALCTAPGSTARNADRAFENAGRVSALSSGQQEAVSRTLRRQPLRGDATAKNGAMRQGLCFGGSDPVFRRLPPPKNLCTPIVAARVATAKHSDEPSLQKTSGFATGSGGCAARDEQCSGNNAAFRLSRAALSQFLQHHCKVMAPRSSTREIERSLSETHFRQREGLAWAVEDNQPTATVV